jgi:hypothetical protein
VVSTLNSLIYPKVNSAIAGAVGAIAGDKDGKNRYSLSSLGVYDESEQLLDALGLSPEDFSANLLAAAFTKLGTDATVSVSVAGTFAVASGVGRGIQAFRALKKVKSPAAESKVLVIGENMSQRVIPYAEKIGAEIYPGMPGYKAGMQAEALLDNGLYIQKAKELGYRIIDIGPDFARCDCHWDG